MARRLATPTSPRHPGISRRAFLRSVALGGTALAGGAVLSACGISGQPSTERTRQTGQAVLDFANWPAYIDFDEADRSPTLEQFRAETGITVNYQQEINGYAEFFAKIRQPLAAGQPIGRDLIVVDNPLAARMIRLGWLEPFDRATMPNLANLLDPLAHPPYDPDRRFTVPWQTGFVGIAYNPALTGRPIERVEDLFAPDLAGRVTSVVEMRDTMGVMLLGLGSDPADHTFAEYEAAITRLSEAVRSGHFRSFTGVEFGADLAAGNIAAAIAWSGVMFQAQLDNPDLRFVIPTDGGMRFTDNLVMPVGAAHKANAERFADFVYRPDIAAQIAAYVAYVTPVDGAREAMRAVDPALVDNELIFPSPSTLARTSEFMVLDEDQERAYQDLFDSVVTG